MQNFAVQLVNLGHLDIHLPLVQVDLALHLGLKLKLDFVNGLLEEQAIFLFLHLQLVVAPRVLEHLLRVLIPLLLQLLLLPLEQHFPLVLLVQKHHPEVFLFGQQVVGLVLPLDFQALPHGFPLVVLFLGLDALLHLGLGVLAQGIRFLLQVVQERHLP